MDIRDFIISQSAGNLYWKDTKGFYLGCNDSFAALLKLKSHEEIRGKSEYDLLGKSALAEKINAIDKKVILLGKEITIEEVGLDIHGKPAIYLSKKVPIKDEKNIVIGLMGISIDITAQKQAEITKQRFIDSIYHEIKTPIAGLDMLSSCMMHAEKDTEKKRTLLFINKAAVRLKDYLNKILEFTAAQRSDNDFNKTISFNIKETMDSLIDMLKPVAVQKNIDITIDCPNEKIKLNKTNFERIVLNLLSNAVKFTDKGKITINVNLLKNKLKLSVQDTGVGISKKDQNMIFESFERVIPSEIEPDYNGCGLGLSIIKMLVLQMKGKISVTSQLKKGSTFTVELPT